MVELLSNLKVCAIGSATAKEIKNRGIKADIVPEKFVAEYLFEELKDILKDTDKVLIPRAKNARDFLVDKISEICYVKEVHIYETVLDDSKKDEVLDSIKLRRSRLYYICKFIYSYKLCGNNRPRKYRQAK